MLIAEELLLLSTKPNGKLLSSMGIDTGVAGAFLCELGQRGVVQVTTDGTLEILNASPSGDPLLDAVAAAFDAKAGEKPEDVLDHIGANVLEATYLRLEHQGMVTREQRKTLGIFTTVTWPPVAAAQDERLRVLTQVLLGERAPDERTGALIALIHACGQTDPLLAKRSGLSGREATRRAEEIAMGDWASTVVRTAIEQAQAAVATVMIAAGVTTTIVMS